MSSRPAEKGYKDIALDLEAVATLDSAFLEEIVRVRLMVARRQGTPSARLEALDPVRRFVRRSAAS